jgi:hypothetical protein
MTDKSLQAHDLSDVLEMAKEAGFTGSILPMIQSELDAFANLIEAKARADERERIMDLGVELGVSQPIYVLNESLFDEKLRGE